jgi:hypothetical protein
MRKRCKNQEKKYLEQNNKIDSAYFIAIRLIVKYLFNFKIINLSHYSHFPQKYNIQNPKPKTIYNRVGLIV